MLAACQANARIGEGATIEIERLAELPLLLMDPQFAVRRSFDAACRLAGLKPRIRMESRTPHTLLALAEAGHGVAIVPSQLQTHRHALHIVGVTYQGNPVREPMIILWDKRRPQPRYARAFCDLLADYVGEVFPISRPTPAES
jgi:DNA-binding transcriptional LysR family regulator